MKLEFTAHSHVGRDGILHLDVATELPDTDVSVRVIVEPEGAGRTKRQPREPGIDEGKVWFAPDFEDPLPEDVLAAFEGAYSTDP
ncbi:MAG: hypothetical protein AAF704_13990 [Cyanobacteria bacterium P01_D01_bin.123]